MSGIAESFHSYPEWYNSERETEKTIQKLTTTKELVFYLRHQDEFIRRLAIVRLNELLLKDSSDYLKELLDDRLESHNNKELAALTIKSISYKWNTDIFFNSKYLSKFDGTETLRNLYQIEVRDSLQKLDFEFSQSLLNMEICSDSEDIKRGREIDFDMTFSFKEWMSYWLEEFKKDYRSRIKLQSANLFKLVTRCIKSSFKIAGVLLRLSASLIKKLFTKGSGKSSDNVRYSLYPGHKKQHAGFLNIDSVKNTAVNFLFILFSPLRFTLKHKYKLFLVLAGIYLMLAYTPYGRLIAYRYTGEELAFWQSSAVEKGKDILSYASSELMDMLGVDQNQKNKSAAGIKPASTAPPGIKSNTTSKLYRIISSSGLNIRSQPTVNSKLASFVSLPYNSTVKYLSRSHKDSQGRLWLYVKTPGGVTGWISARLAAEVKGD